MVTQKRKFLSIRERSLNQGDIRNVPQKILSRDERRQKSQAIDQFNRENIDAARELDKKFEENNYGGSVDNYIQQYNEIRRQNPDVAARLKFNPQTIKQEIDRRIKEVQQLDSDANSKRKKASKDDNRVRRKRFEAEQKAFSLAISELSKGKLLTINQIKDFANTQGLTAEQRARGQEKEVKLSQFNIEREKREQAKNLATTLLFAEEKLRGRQQIQKIKDILPSTNKLSSKDKSIIKNIRQIDLPKVPKKQQLSFLKVATQQTLTPEDKKQIETLVKTEGANLKKAQLNILKNAPKDVATGVFEVGKEIVTLGKDAVVGSFNFGRNLVKRKESGEKNPLANDISKLATGVITVSTFVAKNPKQAAAIVGAAAATGGGQFRDAFFKNPVKTTTKAALYLFPGTAVKGGAKTIKLLGGNIKTIKQATKFKKLQLQTRLLKTSKLSVKQTNKINRALLTASKSPAKRGDQIIRNSLRTILKERGITPAKGLSIDNLVKQIKGARDVLKVKKVLRLKTKKPFLKFEGDKVTRISAKALPTPKLKRARDTTKFLVVEGNKIKKITKKKFLEGQVKKVKVKKTKPKVIGTEKSFNLELSQKGVIKKRGVTFIDLNAIKRIESTKVVVRPVTRVSLRNSKKGSLLFNRQVQIQIQKTEKIVKSKKKIPKTKIKTEKRKLIKLKQIVNAARVVGYAALIKKINAVIKGLDRASSVKPSQKTPSKAKAPAKAKTPAKAKAPAIAKRPAFKQSPRFKTPQKKILKLKTIKPLKKIKITKKPKVFKIKPLDLKFNSKLPSDSRLKYDLRYKEKGKIKRLKLGLPLNKAIKKGFGAVDRTTQASAQLIITGITKIKDIPSTKVASLKNKFRIKKSKDNKVLLFVEKTKNRIDTQGEKKGLKLSKLLKKKSKPKKKLVKKKTISKKKK